MITHHITLRQIRASADFNRCQRRSDNTAYRTEIRTRQITSILTRSPEKSSLLLCLVIGNERKGLVSKDFANQPSRIHFAQGDGHANHLDNYCLSSDRLQHKDNLLFANSSQLESKGALYQSVLLSLTIQSLTCQMRCLNKQEAWNEMEASQRLETDMKGIVVHWRPHIERLKFHRSCGSFIQLLKPQPSRYRRYSSGGQIRS